MLEAGQTMVMECIERSLPTFTKASQNMVVLAVLLDALPTPSTNRVGEIYQRLKSIMGITATQQIESSLQHWVEASSLPPACPRMGDKWLPM
jgi:hypothetical protein